MCSISGFLSSKPLNNNLAQRLASALLHYGAERGNQSAGIYINKKLYKKAIPPGKFINDAAFKAMFFGKNNQCLLHTRYPTCGERGDNQAQPFQQSETVTVHNGWYTNLQELKQRWNIQKHSGVDSELITSFIESYGIASLPEFLETTSGVSAIATIHKNKMYLMRAGNPIAYTTLTLSGGIKLFIFASTAEILESALKYCMLLPRTVELTELDEYTLFAVYPTDIEPLGMMKWNDIEPLEDEQDNSFMANLFEKPWDN